MRRLRFRPVEWIAVSIALCGLAGYFLALAIPWQLVSREPAFLNAVGTAGMISAVAMWVAGITLVFLVAKRR